jgi:hypothetical protein
MKELKVKILEHFERSGYENKELGLTWYNMAHNECILLSQVFEVPLSKVVGVVSSLSPNNKWNRNLHDAWNFLDAPSLETKVCTFMGQRKKALAILESDGSDSEIKRILKGPKTSNFYMNILHYRTSQVVTVDTWAYRSVGLKPTVKNFKVTEQAYKEVASELGLVPHQLQAVVWGVVRGGAR